MVLQLYNLLIAIRNALGVTFISSKAPLCDKQIAVYPFTPLCRKVYPPLKYTANQHRSAQTVDSHVLSNTQCLINYLLIKCSIVIFVLWKVIEIFWTCLFKIKDNIKLQTLITGNELNT